jgi:PAS domain S-box-containing protein
MIEPFHVLIVAASSASAGVVGALQRAGYDPRVREVQTLEGLGIALADRRWDTVVVVAPMMTGDAVEALARIQRQQPQTPVFVWGEPESDVVALIEAGAHDVISPEQPSRFIAALTKLRRSGALSRVPDDTGSVGARAPVGLYRLSPAGRLLYANAAFARLVGCDTVEDLSKVDLLQLDYPRTDFEDRLHEKGEVRGFEARWTTLDGRAIVTRENARSVFDDSGELLYYEGALEDVTEERELLDLEQRRARHYAAIVRYGSALESARSIDQVHVATLEIVCEALRCDAALLIRHEEGKTQVAAHSDAVPAEAASAYVEERPLSEDSPALVATGLSHATGGALEGAGFSAAHSFPLQYRSQRLGAIVALFRQHHVLSEDEEQAGGMFAWHVATALARWDIERAVRASEASLRSIAQATAHTLYRRRLSEPAYDYVSDSLEALTGYDRVGIDELGGFKNLILDTRVLSGTGACIEVEPVPYHALHQIRTRQGEERWVEDRAFPWLDESTGEVLGMAGVLTDVTQQQLEITAEQARNARLLEQQRTLLELASVNLSPAALIHRATEAAGRVTGSARASVWLMNRTARFLVCRDLYLQKDQSHSVVSALELSDLGVGRQLLEEHRVYAIEDLSTLETGSRRLDLHFARSKVCALIAAPIRRQGRLAGFFCVEHTGHPRAWTTDELEFIASLGDLLALALERASRTRAEQALRRSERRYRAVSELASDYAYATTLRPDGTESVEWATQAFERITGYTPEDVPTSDSLVAKVFHPEDRTWAQTELLRVRSGATVDLTVRIVTREGEVRWVRHRARPALDAGGRVYSIYSTGQDVSERIRFETELRVAKERAEAARAEAEAARAQAEKLMQMKTSFVANMSHEIRTPLTAIIGFAEVLADEVSDEQKDFTQLIVSSGRRLLDTLNSVLDLARLESGEVQLAITKVDVAREVRHTLDLFRHFAAVKQVALHLDAPEHLVAQLDRGSLVRIVTNLVSNALKFTEAGHVHLRLEQSEDSFHLSVEDTGIGMDQDFVPHLFDEFKQESEGVRRRSEGSGLGLTITRRLVDLLGGAIEVETEKGSGSTFTVVLPLRVQRTEVPVAEPYLAASPIPLLAMGDGVATTSCDLGASCREFGAVPPDASDGAPVPDLTELFEPGSDERGGDLASLPPVFNNPDTYTVRPVFSTDAAPAGEQAGWIDLGWDDDDLVTAPEGAAISKDDLAVSYTRDLPVMTVPTMDLAHVAESGSDDLVGGPAPDAIRILVVEDDEETLPVLRRIMGSAYHLECVADARTALDRMSRGTYNVLVLDSQLGGKQTGADVLRIARTLPGCEKLAAVALGTADRPEEQAQCLAAGFDGFVSKPLQSDALLEELSRAEAHSALRR